MSRAVHPGGQVPVYVTRRQARLMAEAIWSEMRRSEQYAEIAHIRLGRLVKEEMALAEIRRRLYVAADTP